MTRIALAQVDCRLGEVAGNLKLATTCVQQAAEQGVDLVVFPELSLHGYSLGGLDDDVSLRLDDGRLAELSRHGPAVLIGLLEDGGLRTFNTAAYFENGALTHAQRKLYLPNYLGWEERKHAAPGQRLRAFDADGGIGRAAVLICNDAWQPVLPWLAVQDGAELLLVPTNSAAPASGPNALDAVDYWADLLRFTARMHQTWVVFVNRVGEEPGIRFWGGSRVLDPHGTVVAEAAMWDEDLVVVDVDIDLARRFRHRLPLVREARLGLVRQELDRLIAEGGDA